MMDDKTKRTLRIMHVIEQDAALARDFEDKVELTGMEVMALASMAKFGCMVLQASVSKNYGQQFLDLAKAYLESIDKEMESLDKPGGVHSVHRMCMAVISQEHVNQWSFDLNPEFVSPELLKDMEDMG